MARKGEKSASKRLAARMRDLKIERITAKCGCCYKTISRESSQSRYTHRCQG